MKEYEYNGKAMGTDFSISIITDSQKVADVLAREAIEQISAYENCFSRFLPDSELSILNREKSGVVSERFMAVVQRAYTLFVATKGIFNPLVQIERLGYRTTFSDTSDTAEEPYDIDFSSTKIDLHTRLITLGHGQKFDFGGFLKGYLAELLATKIKNVPCIQGVIINLGGDIHTLGVDENADTFVFDIYNPFTQKEALSVPLHNQSLATSGTYKRQWHTAQGMTHHILNAQGTHNPASDIVSASVIATDGATAEAYAKVFLSVGETEAQQILQDKQLSFIVIKNDGTIVTNI